MQAIILAAGMGKRLKDLTQNHTKCMVKVNGVTLISRMLAQLDKYNLNRIVIVVGYKGDELINYINTLGIKTPIEYIRNDVYDKTNNIYSLFLASKELAEASTLLLESDLIFEDEVLDALINDKCETLALVDKYESWMDGTVVKIDKNNKIREFIPGCDFRFEDIKDYYKTVNIYKFSKEFSRKFYLPFLKAYSTALGNNEYYEQVLRVITMMDDPEIKAKPLCGEKWYEIDDIQDLDIAESIFAESEKRLEKISGRRGGYWRYPKIIDFCYLVNPYFPPKRLLDEIKANIEKLITQYPSEIRVNSLLAAKNFSIKQENIVVGNGTTELIKSIINAFDDKRIGIIRPSFEEYPNSFTKNNHVVFNTETLNYQYSIGDIMDFFKNKDLSVLVMMNPNNPTGNYISSEDIERLAEWCGKKDIKLVLDESFSDFAEEDDNTLIRQEVVNKYDNLIIVKSISKSFGIPGLRLGVAVSGDVNFISELKSDVAIWNINSIGEFFMQIVEKYRKDYVNANKKLIRARKTMIAELKKNDGLKIYPSQANYIMIELVGGLTSSYLARELLDKKQLLIRDLSTEMKNERQFIGVAVKKEEDNERLVSGIKEIMENYKY